MKKFLRMHELEKISLNAWIPNVDCCLSKWLNPSDRWNWLLIWFRNASYWYEVWEIKGLLRIKVWNRIEHPWLARLKTPWCSCAAARECLRCYASQFKNVVLLRIIHALSSSKAQHSCAAAPSYWAVACAPEAVALGVLFASLSACSCWP